MDFGWRIGVFHALSKILIVYIGMEDLLVLVELQHWVFFLMDFILMAHHNPSTQPTPALAATPDSALHLTTAVQSMSTIGME